MRGARAWCRQVEGLRRLRLHGGGGRAGGQALPEDQECVPGIQENSESETVSEVVESLDLLC